MAEYIEREALLELINEDCKYKNPTNEYTRGCNEVCDWAINIIKNMPTADVAKNEWISVDERLPEKDGLYLIFSPYTNKEGGIVYCNRFLTKGNPIFSSNSFESISKVTHWMPLPEPPRTPKERGGEK